jgi:hypothetical protein
LYLFFASDGDINIEKQKPNATTDENTGKIIEEEERFTGSVSSYVYKEYFLNAGSKLFLFAIGIICILFEFGVITTNAWLAFHSSVNAGAYCSFLYSFCKYSFKFHPFTIRSK